MCRAPLRPALAPPLPLHPAFASQHSPPSLENLKLNTRSSEQVIKKECNRVRPHDRLVWYRLSHGNPNWHSEKWSTNFKSCEPISTSGLTYVISTAATSKLQEAGISILIVCKIWPLCFKSRRRSWDFREFKSTSQNSSVSNSDVACDNKGCVSSHWLT